LVGVPRVAKGERDLFLLDEAADLLDRLWWTVVIVQRDEVDFVAGHAALLVHHTEERAL